MTVTHVYVNPALASDSGTGTIGDPYGDLQYALNTQARDTTNGNQFNIKVGTAEILAAALTLATYGTPTTAAPLILRGYTNTANDGGMAEINCNGFPMFTTSYVETAVVNLECHTFGNNHGITLSTGGGGGGGVIACEVHKGTSTPSGKALIRAASQVVGCYLHDAGTSGSGIVNTYNAIGNFITDCANGIADNYCSVLGNIIRLDANGSGIKVWQLDTKAVMHNIIYSTVANTGMGIQVSDASGRLTASVLNNIICGFSGVGGRAISLNGENLVVLGHNAFWNNTSKLAYADGDAYVYDLTTGDVDLAADPFTDAANGDFSLTTAGKAALRGVGWPAAYFGAHTNTDGHVTIGPVQYGEAEAAGVLRRVMRMLGG